MARSIRDLAAYRYERALEELSNASGLLDAGKYRLALNRSYYAIFHAMRSVNALDEFDSSKHSGVIAHFNRFHVKNGDFPREISKVIGSASSMREHADYDDFFVVSRQETETQIHNAEWFVAYTGVFLRQKGIIE